MSQSRIRNSTYILVPIAVCAALMVPRLLSCQFGLFDDPGNLVTVKQMWSGSWSIAEEAGSGRFRPVYWFYQAMVYGVAGKNPIIFFAMNLILLIGLTVGVTLLTEGFLGSRPLACAAGIVFALSGPIVESVYTLSKPELLQSLWLVLSLLLAFWAPRAAGLRWVLRTAVAAIVVFLAAATKETTAVLLPIAAVWLVVAWLGKKRNPESAAHYARAASAFFVAVVLGLLLYLALRSREIGVGIAPTSYASNYALEPHRMLGAARAWIDWLNRDFLFLAPLAVLPVIALLRRNRLPHVGMLLGSGTWTAGWVMVYLPWLHQVEYYLLPAAMGVAVLAAVLLRQTSVMIRILRGRAAVLGRFFVGAAVVLLMLTLPNNLSNAKLQLAVDASNAEMLSAVILELPPGGVLLVNIQESNEYVDQTAVWIREVEGRRDLIVRALQLEGGRVMGEGGTGYFVVSPFLENQFYPSVRLGVYEHTARAWEASFREALDSPPVLVFETRHQFRSWLIDPLRLICPLVPTTSYCQVPNAPVDSRLVAYGWRLYQVGNMASEPREGARLVEERDRASDAALHP